MLSRNSPSESYSECREGISGRKARTLTPPFRAPVLGFGPRLHGDFGFSTEDVSQWLAKVQLSAS